LSMLAGDRLLVSQRIPLIAHCGNLGLGERVCRLALSQPKQRPYSGFSLGAASTIGRSSRSKRKSYGHLHRTPARLTVRPRHARASSPADREYGLALPSVTS
jgi:hypothetical protein